MDSERFKELMEEARKQGFEVVPVLAWIFRKEDHQFVCLGIPETMQDWQEVLWALTMAGLIWPPRKNHRRGI